MPVDAISNQSITPVAPSTTLPIGTDTSSENDSPIQSAPDVQVSISDTGRQLALETQQRTTVSDLDESDSTQAQSEQRDLAETNQAQLREVGAQSESIVSSATITPVEESETEVVEQVVAPSTPQQSVEEPDSETLEVDDSDTTQTLASANNTAQASEPVNSSQSASVVTQYNSSPEAALGQTISVSA